MPVAISGAPTCLDCDRAQQIERAICLDIFLALFKEGLALSERITNRSRVAMPSTCGSNRLSQDLIRRGRFFQLMEHPFTRLKSSKILQTSISDIEIDIFRRRAIHFNFHFTDYRSVPKTIENVSHGVETQVCACLSVAEGVARDQHCRDRDQYNRGAASRTERCLGSCLLFFAGHHLFRDGPYIRQTTCPGMNPCLHLQISSPCSPAGK